MPTLRQSFCAMVVATLILTGGVWQASRVAGRSVDAAFWFEAVTYGPREAMVERLGGPLTAEDLSIIAGVARREVAQAFSGLAVSFSEDPDATYRVRVVQDLRNARAPKYPGPAGESRAVRGFGGQGAVNFRRLVSSAVVYAPPGSTRAAVVEAIGRGVGRTAVHEFAHQFLTSEPFDATQDRLSYEFRSADRPEYFYAPLRWGRVRPLLEARLGVTPADHR